jgi:hypothetical protein
MEKMSWNKLLGLWCVVALICLAWTFAFHAIARWPFLTGIGFASIVVAIISGGKERS